MNYQKQRPRKDQVRAPQNKEWIDHSNGKAIAKINSRNLEEAMVSRKNINIAVILKNRIYIMSSITKSLTEVLSKKMKIIRSRRQNL